ncbi:hypothetical protein EV361DRAFT_952793 [Lentinula raphanica]|nr:hypothetical protein EV361DRAFT_952793 [Lentinula raphanica]
MVFFLFRTSPSQNHSGSRSGSTSANAYHLRSILTVLFLILGVTSLACAGPIHALEEPPIRVVSPELSQSARSSPSRQPTMPIANFETAVHYQLIYGASDNLPSSIKGGGLQGGLDDHNELHQATVVFMRKFKFDTNKLRESKVLGTPKVDKDGFVWSQIVDSSDKTGKVFFKLRVMPQSMVAGSGDRMYGEVYDANGRELFRLWGSRSNEVIEGSKLGQGVTKQDLPEGWVLSKLI